MPEIGTSGLMSGDGKRGGALRQCSRPSSTLLASPRASARKSAGAADTSVCATARCDRLSWTTWRRHSCVCPKGADYQWGKDPLEQLMVRFDSYRAARLGNQASRNLVKKSTLGGRATWQAVTRVKLEQASKAAMW